MDVMTGAENNLTLVERFAYAVGAPASNFTDIAFTADVNGNMASKGVPHGNWQALMRPQTDSF
jgi:hypothetical protein